MWQTLNKYPYKTFLSNVTEDKDLHKTCIRWSHVATFVEVEAHICKSTHKVMIAFEMIYIHTYFFEYLAKSRTGCCCTQFSLQTLLQRGEVEYKQKKKQNAIREPWIDQYIQYFVLKNIQSDFFAFTKHSLNSLNDIFQLT